MYAAMWACCPYAAALPVEEGLRRLLYVLIVDVGRFLQERAPQLALPAIHPILEGLAQARVEVSHVGEVQLESLQLLLHMGNIIACVVRCSLLSLMGGVSYGRGVSFS